MGDDGGWCTIESDPGVFTELIEKIGVKGVQVEELYALDKVLLDGLKPVYGLIFLFKYVKETETRLVLEDGAPGVFFARQMINNACATQAIISILLNRKEITLGSELTNFKDFAIALDPEMRGTVLGSSTTIQAAHNSFRRPEPFVTESVESKEDDDVYHFIGYVPVNGNLYELDGLKKGPILLGDCTDTNWLDQVTPHIQERIARYSEKEVRFNLLALVRNRKEVLTEELKVLETKKKDAGEQAAIAEIQAQMADIKSKLEEEEEKRKKWTTENIRRKHNYVPFIFALLKKLAKDGKLPALIEESKKKKAARIEKNATQKKKETSKADEGDGAKKK
eukprot:gb/GEZN01004760.1/.p1 GENE.gb/GEZN01004760.1/~~gb/GEZN01004760.1/.p1  ORF type:complete len:337 (-),score=76.76 gb/GEZN01004760.1/:360-1370(-)